jgi:hypothetical protein
MIRRISFRRSPLRCGSRFLPGESEIDPRLEWLYEQITQRSPGMRLEELQAIWETQAERPVFAVNDFGMHFALYQLRERAR